uniref:RNA-directed DNA polymerase, eukaryota, reverse transcriptase zinc-binding domain protein n=1 Tax=Tanacetum cinerariifolium TaxID=118510 RepID=A0A699ILU2_TANCI|nr:hypothetical protein [Tanacetum cinerariifolium]
MEQQDIENTKAVNSDMRIAVWNVRGMCNKSKQKEAKTVIEEEYLKFISIVGKEWNIQVSGCEMLKLVKKLKAFKTCMKALSWMHGNLHFRVVELTEKLQILQSKVDVDPFDIVLSEEETSVLSEYKIANITRHFQNFLGCFVRVQMLPSIDFCNKITHMI